jgi:hypothetical protein
VPLCAVGAEKGRAAYRQHVRLPHRGRCNISAMTDDDIRKWVGTYVLILTIITGGYLFIAPDFILPLEASDRTASFEIIVPFLLGQVAAVFRFYGTPSRRASDGRDNTAALPGFVVRLPLIAVGALIGIQFTLCAIAGIRRTEPPSPELFKGLLTFCVALLNASTIFIIGRYFRVNYLTVSEPYVTHLCVFRGVYVSRMCAAGNRILSAGRSRVGCARRNSGACRAWC